jgi:hypothetical protein
MANELAIAGVTSGSTVVVWVRRDADEYIFNVTDTAFEVYSDASRDAGDYDVVLTEQGTSEYYVGDFPTDIATAGLYNLAFYSRTGASTPYDYEFETAGTLSWSGSAEEASPAGLNWVTAAQYKTFRGITDTSLDAWLTQTIPQVSAALNTYLGRTVRQTAHTKVFSGKRGCSGLNVGEYPIASITSVTFNYLSDGPEVVDGSEFYANEVGTIRFNPSSADARYFNTPFVKVVFVAGHSSVPQDLQLAAMLVLQAFEFQADSEQLVTEKSVKDVKVKYGSPLMADMSDPIFGNAKAILDRHSANNLMVI